MKEKNGLQAEFSLSKIKEFSVCPIGKNVISGAGESTKLRFNGDMDCDLLEFDEVCGLLKVGRSTLYKLVNEKAIKAVKLLGRTLFRKADVYNFIAALPEYEGGPNGF